jgi:hypothetical protein
MAQPLALMGQSVRAAQDGIEQLRVDAALAKFSGAELEAYERLATAREELLPALEEYAAALEDTAYAMTVCGR